MTTIGNLRISMILSGMMIAGALGGTGCGKGEKDRTPTASRSAEQADSETPPSMPEMELPADQPSAAPAKAHEHPANAAPKDHPAH